MGAIKNAVIEIEDEFKDDISAMALEIAKLRERVKMQESMMLLGQANIMSGIRRINIYLDSIEA